MAQDNREVVARAHQQVNTMASCIRDITRVNPPTFDGSKVEEVPQEIIDEVYKILFAMGLSTSEQDNLATYQFKDVAQTWYVQGRENRPLKGGPVTWGIFKKAFLDQFFPRLMREAKVSKFINLRQVGMSMLEYSMKFTQLSKFAPSMVFDPRDEMNLFVAWQVEEERARRKSRDAKRATSYGGGSLKNRLEIQDKTIFKKRFSNQVPTKFPKARNEKGENPKTIKGRGTSSPNTKLTYGE
ncbi:uncharacterized protein LOC107030091 [Solanum pennellii]|uniref:Uncharacterized protein LOC107030091 n=1 Tax=Solanum pennellii TaxID=28526 RepID=A0ABM1HKX4_SOLPN|nr:uncharacterized protein LOC107030091 [Solanum pennellii]